MKLYKSLFIVTAIVAGLLTSCSEDGVWNKAQTADLFLTNGTSYTFDNTSCSYTYYPADMTNGIQIPVTVRRGTTAGNYTLPIAASFSNDETLSGPASVTFEDGSNTAIYTITVNKDLAIGETVTANLVIDTLSIGIPAVAKPKELTPESTAADSAQYEIETAAYETYLKKLSAYKIVTEISLMKDYNWESLGKGTYNDFFLVENAVPCESEIFRAVENPKVYRVTMDYASILDQVGGEADGNQSKYTTITLLDKGQDFRGVTIDGDNYVYFTPINSGYYSSANEADYVLYHPMDFSVNWARYNNTSYVMKYQEDGTPAMIQLSGLYLLEGTSRGGAPCQKGAPLAQIVFPGVKIFDYSATMEYAGLFTDTKNIVYALADYELTGADAKKASAYKVAVVSQNVDADAVADAILAGEYEAADLKDVAKDGRIQIEIPEELTGKLQVILVIIDGDEVKNVVAAPFEYYGGKNPWKSLGTDGVYYDDFVVPFATGYAYGPWPVEVEVEEHSETPGLYRVKAMYAGIADAFKKTGGENEILIHAENPNAVYFLTQPTGLDLGDGEYSIVSYGGDDIEYFGQQGYSADVVIGAFPEDFGTLKDGVITLPIIQRKDADGNPMYDDEGNPRIYQGYLYQGSDGYYACTNGGFQLILPGASPAAVAKAKRAAAAANFEYRLNGGAANMVKVNKKDSFKRHRRLTFDFSK